MSSRNGALVTALAIAAVVGVSLFGAVPAQAAAPPAAPRTAVNTATASAVTDVNILALYVAMGGAQGALGAPTGLSAWNPANGGGIVQGFERGAVTHTAASGAVALLEPMRAAYSALGGLSGSFGWPTSSVATVSANGGGQVQGFQNGALTWTARSGVVPLSGEIRATYAREGGVTGSLGWPLGASSAVGSGAVQAFQNGAITSSSSYGTHAISGAIRALYGVVGGIYGRLGWPAGDANTFSANGGGSAQAFANGAITHTVATGAVLLDGPIRAFYNSRGGVLGTIGWPSKAATCQASGGCSQSFTKGIIDVTPSGVAWLRGEPVPSSRPDGTNTGVPVGTVLTVRTGDLVLSTPGQVVSGLDIRGMVTIKAANVTIKNSIIRGRVLTGPAALVNNMGNHANLNIIDTEMFPSTPSPHVQGFYGSNATFTRVNMHGVVDGVHITGSNVSIQHSWIHDNLHYLVDPNQGGRPSHDDTIQIQIGNNIVINGNTLTGSHSAAVMITQDRGKVSNVTFTNNFADNGACTVNVAQKTFGPIVGMSVLDNRFGRNTRIANCAVISPSTTVINTARNYYVPDNTLVTVKRG